MHFPIRYGRIAEHIESRNENQIRSYVNKKFDPDVYSANCAAAKDVSMQGRERNRIGGGNILSFEPDN